MRPHPHLVGTPVASLGRMDAVCTWWLPSVCSKGVGDCAGGDGVARLRAMQLGVCESFKRGLVRIVPVGGLVLDPFCGSGTTLVAALAEGRSALGFELSAHYAEIARNRCAEAALRCLWASDDTVGAAP